MDSTINSGPNQIHFVAVNRVVPHAPRENAGPNEGTVWEDAPHGCQVFFDRCQEVRGAVSAQVIATQVHDEDVRVRPNGLELVELGK